MPLDHLRPHHLRRESPAVLELQHAVSGALLDIVLSDVALRIDVEPAGGRADQCAVRERWTQKNGETNWKTQDGVARSGTSPKKAL